MNFHKKSKSNYWKTFFYHNDSPYLKSNHSALIALLLVCGGIALAAVFFGPQMADAASVATLAPLAVIGMAGFVDPVQGVPPAGDVELKKLSEELGKGLHDFKEKLEKRDKEIDKFGTELGGTKAVLERLNAELDRLEKAYKDRMDKLEARLNAPGSGQPEDRDKLAAAKEKEKFFHYLRSGGGEGVSRDLLEAIKNGTLDKFSSNLDVSDLTKGGAIYPNAFSTSIIEATKNVTPALQLADVQTDNTPGIDIPINTALPTCSEVNPVGTRTEGSLTMGLKSMKKRALYVLLKPPEALLTLSPIPNIEAWLNQQCVDALSIGVGGKFANGAGEPQSAWEGIATNASITSVSSGDASLMKAGTGGAKGFLAFVYSLPAQYARNARILCTRRTRGLIRGLTAIDAGAAALYTFDANTGTPMAEGVPIVECPDLAEVAANAYPCFIGDFKAGFKISLSTIVAVKRLNELYASEGCIGLLHTLYACGVVGQTDAIRKFKIAA